MPDLSFRILNVEPAARGLTPLLQFRVEISNAPPAETIHAVLLHAQIQIQSPQRTYTPDEKERLVEIFGTPDTWGRTLRNQLWAHAHATVGAFAGGVVTFLAVPCTYDVNIAAGKYFYALGEGDVPLLFLFSGTVFYASSDGVASPPNFLGCGVRLSDAGAGVAGGDGGALPEQRLGLFEPRRI